MANQPYIPLYTGDWKKDPKLSMCSPSTRGIWIDLLCSLHDARISQLTATPDQFARLCRCDTGSMLAALLELQSTGAANVSKREEAFTVVCRRMKKAEDLSRMRAEAGSKGGAKAKQKESCPDIDIEDGIDRGTENGLNKVRAFAREKSIIEKDAEWFYWKGRGNGWTNGGKPMLDWKATLLSWHRAGYLPSQKQSRNGPTEYVRPKEKAPFYPKPSETREVSDEELAKQREIIRKSTQELQQQMRMPK